MTTNTQKNFHGCNLEINIHAEEIIAFLMRNYKYTPDLFADYYKDVQYTDSFLYTPHITVPNARLVLRSVSSITVKPLFRLPLIKQEKEPYFFTCTGSTRIDHDNENAMNFLEFLIFLQMSLATNRSSFFRKHAKKRFVTINQSLSLGEKSYTVVQPFTLGFSHQIIVEVHNHYNFRFDDVLLVKEIKKHPI